MFLRLDLPKLKILDLEGCDFSKGFPPELLQKLTSLTELGIPSCNLKKIPDG